MSLSAIVLHGFLRYIILCRIIQGTKPHFRITIVEEDRYYHDDERLWPLPWSKVQGRPNQVHSCHPHTMDDDACPRFGLNPSGTQVASNIADSGFL
jgi:hypothetical protein